MGILGGLSRYESLYLLIAVLQFLAVAPTLIFAVVQLRKQQQAVSYDTYQRLVTLNSNHTWLTSEHPILDSIWEPWPDGRKLELDNAQHHMKWGAWYLMDVEERRCYNFTWMRIQLHEQQWQLSQNRALDAETWNKWSSWGQTLGATRYFAYVMADCSEMLLPKFVTYLSDDCGLKWQSQLIAKLAPGSSE